ncbi:hypothetical protein Tco_0943487, partial [Tanacetum coccineum]
VWNFVVHKSNIPIVPPIWSDIMGWLLPIAKKNNALSIVGRLIVAASSYYILQERNNRLHGNRRSASGGRCLNLESYVLCLKLASIRFKRNANVKLKKTWNILLIE